MTLKLSLRPGIVLVIKYLSMRIQGALTWVLYHWHFHHSYGVVEVNCGNDGTGGTYHWQLESMPQVLHICHHTNFGSFYYQFQLQLEFQIQAD